LDTRVSIRPDDNIVTVLFNESIRISAFSLSGAKTASYGTSDLDPHGLPIPSILAADGSKLPGVTYKATIVPGPDGKPVPVPDTETRPELTYSPTHCGFTDLPGNVMPAIAPLSVVESDGAAPIIVKAGGFIGDSNLYVKFSEPVDDGERGALVRDDFNYYDVDRLGVAGKSSTEEVCHGDGSYIIAVSGCPNRPLDTAIIPLSGPLTASDRDRDVLAAVVGKIREVAPSVPEALRQSVPNVKTNLTTATDSTPPGPIRDLRVEDALTDAGSVTLSWTAPGQDDLGGGPVAHYSVKVSNGTAITDITKVVNPNSVVINLAQPLADANHTQTVQVLGLQPKTTYHFMVQAIDGGGNLGPQSQDVSTQTTRDVTPPECLGTGTTIVACPLTVTSSDCKTGAPVARRDCTFAWSNAQDKESPNSLLYRYKASHEEIDRVLGTDDAVKVNSAKYTFPENGTWWFHVAAFSGGGYTLTAHYKVVIGAGVLNPDDIVAANDLLQKDVHPVRLVDAVNNTYVNEVRWTLPAQSDLPGSVVGLEIWRKDGAGTFLLVKRLDGSYSDLATGAWRDNTVGANADSEYRVQMVFAGTPEQTQPDPQTGYKSLEDETPQGIAWWAWILIGVGLALLVAGVVIFFVLRGKQQQAAGSVAYAWESANPDQIGIDEATGLPVHEVRCPSCNNPFQAIGNLPLPVTCPNCGTTGTLD
ncbi:MAG: fibronectin type III domain-containing protein, partial [Halobacteriales archaeon]|nr:fibronectin type III domain-containing protein [Halobacteriales archaeon]